MTRYLPDVNIWFALMQIRHQHHVTTDQAFKQFKGLDLAVLG